MGLTNMEWFKSYLLNHSVSKEWLAYKSDFAHLSLIQEALLLSVSAQESENPIVVIKEDENAAMNLADMLRKLSKDIKVGLYIHETSLRIEALSESDFMRSKRIETLYQLISKGTDILITHPAAVVRKTSSKKTLEDAVISLEIDQVYDPKELMNELIRIGYQRVKYVDRPFTFSQRGGVLDVFSINHQYPIRIEFFDDEVESLRYFDIKTQRSVEKLTKAVIIFASEIIISSDERESIVNQIKNDIKSETLKEKIGLSLEQFRLGSYELSMYPYLSYWQENNSVLDIINKNSKLIASPIELVERYHKDYLLDAISFLQEQEQLEENIAPNNIFIPIEDATKDYDLIEVHEFQTDAEMKYIPWHLNRLSFSNPQDSFNWIAKQSEHRTSIIIYEDGEREKLLSYLNQLNLDYREEYSQTPGIIVQPSSIRIDITLEDIKTDIYYFNNILIDDRKTYRYDNKFYQAESLERLQDLDNSDYVVHRQYGIGRYLGIATRAYDNIEKDFMRIMYQGGDELFVPLEQFHLVRKYMSKDAQAVKLNKLGSKTWERNKAKVKEDVALVADKLVRLYSERSEAKGFAFSPDNELQVKFESEFPYDLTPDQKQAVIEVKQDMEKPVPMDRLLSGDVGFGKTEVAIRASFKAIMDDKQVAFLCPTTILSAQHHKTYLERFKNYPVRVEVLNRFVSEKKQKEILQDLKEGKVDVIIGTHRILSKDVLYKDLGLLIIDEEQRFGVQDKEKLKELRVSVDVLSLSATPIPRTLQMSLVGLRSLSQLNTPPKNRIPIMTYVIEKDETTLNDVILKELRRDGQVFYLFNNINRIYEIANKIDKTIEDARVGIIHGQMDRDMIEDIMFEFQAKRINVLVCTTIIETGIDIPNANTMIVDNAHQFGLSQLYQIKGRVGRSDRLAYAYFVVPKKKNLTEVAQKRLQAIQEFSQLGSGYKIAMRDLSIRGAGELLGANQSGFIDTVGMELYVELLKEAIAERKGQDVKKKTDRYILQTSAYLPEGFAATDDEKLDIYEAIQAINDLDSWLMLYESLEDRYGQLPEEVEQLLNKSKLELLLKDETKIEKFIQKYNHVILRLSKNYSDKIDGMHLFQMISERSYDIEIKYINNAIEIQVPNTREWVEDFVYILDNIKEQDNNEVR